MGMKEELRELKRKRREEVRLLHTTYLRTKRDVKRAISPDRMIRKHMGASVGLAVVAGLLLAPSLGGRRKDRVKKPSSIVKWTKSLLRKFVPGAEKYIPAEDEIDSHVAEDQAQEAEARFNGNGHHQPSRKTKGLLAKLVTEAGMLLLSKMDVHKIISEVMEGIKRGRKHEVKEGSPHVSVADVGTVREDPLSDLQ